MIAAESDTETEDADSLPLRELVRIAGGRCQDCQVPYTAREAVWSIALGFKNAPRCQTCLSRRLDRTESDLATSITDYVQRRECYLRAWKVAVKMDEGEPVRQTMASPHPDVSEPIIMETEANLWDAGDLGCGDLVMQLRIRLKKMAPGNVIHVTATDPAAPEDIPAWCRLTGHTLLNANHPNYSIRRKED